MRQTTYVLLSSRRRHTSSALVTGVQTCTLPIWATERSSSSVYPRTQLRLGGKPPSLRNPLPTGERRSADRLPGLRPIGEETLDPLVGQRVLDELADHGGRRGHHHGADPRSEERRVGKAGCSPGSSRWSPDH